jgi:dTDP-4-amino-4,6-dideoxygalactose transaminase
MFVGIGGNPTNLVKISKLCKKNGLILILDAAHMAGTRIGGQAASEYADITCYSFQAVKNLPTGDSGMITTSNLRVYEMAKALSWLGIDKETYSRVNSEGYSWKYDVKEVGYKHNGNSIMASLGIIGLKYLEEDNAWRRVLAETYKSELEDVTGISFVREENNVKSSQHLFQVIINRRDEVIQSLRLQGISTGVHYVTNTDYPMYKHMKNQTPNASKLSERLLSLPLFVDLTKDQAVEIASKLKIILSEV